jgi:hypothetical protein
LGNFLGKDRRRIADVATVNAKIRKIFWINILDRHNAAGSGTPTANALGGAADV